MIRLAKMPIRFSTHDDDCAINRHKACDCGEEACRAKLRQSNSFIKRDLALPGTTVFGPGTDAKAIIGRMVRNSVATAASCKTEPEEPEEPEEPRERPVIVPGRGRPRGVTR